MIANQSDEKRRGELSFTASYLQYPLADFFVDCSIAMDL